MITFSPADSLHRLVKEALDSGAVPSIAHATDMFRGFRLGFSIAEAEACDPHYQAALLTGVALARRVFLGGVMVSGPMVAPLKTPLPLGSTIGEAVIRLGGSIGDYSTTEPLVTIGGGPQSHSRDFHIRTAHAGWRCGIVPAHQMAAPSGGHVMPLASMLSAALAVNEAFLLARGPQTRHLGVV